MSEKIFLLTTTLNQKASSTNFNKLKEYAEEVLSTQLFKFKVTTGPSSFFETDQYVEQDEYFHASIKEMAKNNMGPSYNHVVFELTIESVKTIN